MAKKSTVQKVAEKVSAKPVEKKTRKKSDKPRAPRTLRSFIVMCEDGSTKHLKNYCLMQGIKYITVLNRLRKRPGEALILKHDDPVFSESARKAARKVIVISNGRVVEMSPTNAYKIEGAVFIAAKKKVSFDGVHWHEIPFVEDINQVTESVPTAAPSDDSSDDDDEDIDSDDVDSDEDDDSDEDIE